LLRLFNKNDNTELINHFIEDRNKIYISCFSMFNEDNEISELINARYMWKFYAYDDNGVVIKFELPYIESAIRRVSNGNGGFNRISQIGKSDAQYDAENLKKNLKRCVTLKACKWHIFATDVYKPEFCELEREIRLIVYVVDRCDLNGLQWVSESANNSHELPEYLYYDFGSQETNETAPWIQKVFCRTNKTRDVLVNILGEERVKLIDVRPIM